MVNFRSFFFLLSELTFVHLSFSMGICILAWIELLGKFSRLKECESHNELCLVKTPPLILYLHITANQLMVTVTAA